MNSLTKITITGLPAVLGISLSWIAVRLIQNEKSIAARKMELENQLGSNSLKGL